MRFNLKLDAKHCMLKDGRTCPMSEFDGKTCKAECRYYKAIITSCPVWYTRCPECLAEEKRQKEKRKRYKSATEQMAAIMRTIK